MNDIFDDRLDNDSARVLASADELARHLASRELEPMRMQDPRIIHVEQIESFVLSAIVMTGGLIGLVALALTHGLGWLFSLSGLALSVVGILLIWTIFAWPKIRYQHYFWRLNPERMEIHRGVWWRHRVAIPLGRVQHADVMQGPLLRRFGLAVLVVHTAGTSENKILLEGIDYATAIQLRDCLVAQTQGRVVT